METWEHRKEERDNTAESAVVQESVTETEPEPVPSPVCLVIVRSSIFP